MNARGATQKRAREVPDTVQRGFVFEELGGQSSAPKERGCRVQFEEGHRRQYVGEVPLEQYLEQCGLKAVRVLRELMEQVDVSAFEEAYKPGGRRPIHPRRVLSLIFYGMQLKQWSLRELEQLAKRDVGAWLLCGGLQPDHSTLGKFIVRHEQLLSDAFFVSTTRTLAQKLGLKEGEAAADGTVIQAASGLRSLAKKEVLQAEAEQARQAAAAEAQAAAQAQPQSARQEAAAVAEAQAEAQAQPQPAPQEHTALEKKAQLLEQAVEIATQRTEARTEQRRSPPQLSRHEPEAINQPCKDGLYRLSYKPSVLVHDSGIILAQALHPSSEVQVLEGLLEQTRQVGVELQSLALDGGSFQIQVLQWALTQQLDVLCPPERLNRNEAGLPVTHKGLFAKAAFRYDEHNDVYRCPAGHTLRPGKWKVEADTQMRVRHYGTPACKQCPLRSQCTSSQSSPRKIGRHEGQELKDAMVQVFAQPAARKRYARRSHMVEPVFAELKERQGLRRFHRKGQRGARLEFSLHCLAFNLKRAVLGVVVLEVRCSPGGHCLLVLYLSVHLF